MNINNIISPTEAPKGQTAPLTTSLEKPVSGVKSILKETEGDKDQRLTVETTREMVEELNDYMDDLQTNLGFSINEELHSPVIVEIKNRETNELLKQIPSEELIHIREKMIELTGLILDDKV